MTQVKLSYEEQILNALIRLGGAKKGENATGYNGRRFDAVREVLRPLYDRLKQLEDELRLGTGREAAVRCARTVLVSLDELKESDPPPADHKTSLRHLRHMCEQIIEHAGHVPREWPTTKLNRWLGYVQGVLAARGFMKDEERWHELGLEDV